MTNGINFPQRGEKHTNWQGGMAGAAFVSGGYVPEHLRGTHNNHTFHVADWCGCARPFLCVWRLCAEKMRRYATFATLAGVSPRDDPPVPPKKPNPADPHQDLYGNNSFPLVDGVDIMPMILNPESYPRDAAHKSLVLSAEVREGAWALQGCSNLCMRALRGQDRRC